MMDPPSLQWAKPRVATIALWMVIVTACLLGEANAANGLTEWRAAVIETRRLAENDIPAALRQAQRLQTEIPEGATSADRARLLNALARAEVYYGYIDQAARHAEQAFNLAKQHGDKAGQAEADLNLAVSRVNQGRIEAMNAAVMRSMTILRGVDRPDLLAEAMLRTSMMYRRMDQVNDSVAVAVQLMSIARHSTNPLVRTYAYHAMASANDLGGRPAEGLAYYARMREEARRANSAILEAEALVGMAGAMSKLGDTKKAEQFAHESIEMHRRIGANISANRGLLLLAGFLQEAGRTREAISVLDEVIREYEGYRVPIGLWWGLDTRSKYYKTLGALVEAQADAERAYAVAREIGFPFYLSESASSLAGVVAAAGDYERAYKLSVEAADMKAKAVTEKAGERMAQLTSRYEQESRRKEIEELTQRNERQAAELVQRELHQRWLWTLLGGSVLMLAGSALFLFRLRRSHRRLTVANTQLRRSRQKIRELNVDLEQRVQARTAELRQQTRYLQTMIDMLPMMAWFKDTESRYLVINQRVAKILGYPTDGFIGKTDMDFWPAELAQAYRQDDTEVMATRESKTVEEPMIEDGKTVWIETYKAAVIDDDGTLLGTVGAARNISERKATEAAREAALTEAKRLAHMRSQFLAQMSHELRTPLNGILGYAQIMKRDKALNERQLDGLNVIQQSGEHLLMLINDILEFAKIDAGKMDLNPSDMALDRFLRMIVSIIGVRAEQKHLKFVPEIAPDLPDWIRADEKRLRQVLLNLLANAVKFTDAGEVRLRVRMSSPTRLHFEVSDTGIGITPENLERIFQPFEQVGDVQQRAAGTGLGLSISRQLVRLMGSDIVVESEPGRGSTFRFELDAHVAEAGQAGPHMRGQVSGYAGDRRKVLVADDVAENRSLMHDILTPLGFEVLQAVNGRDAVDMTRLHAPDIILMDLVMPEMDGLDATRAIRQMSGCEEIPIIAVSASASGQDEESSLAAGMNVFLPKPIELDRLLASMASALQLDWIYEQPSVEPPQVEREIVAPPAHEMKALHQLALHGNMRDIVLTAERLAQLDERYKPFALKLRAMAKGYQSRAILSFVERYLDREAEE
ncbi:MAG TPA: ATP-binding protein [Methylophilaceae bacterium]|nr:ATP-binding protein [Methylophilaceae bacterium]